MSEDTKTITLSKPVLFGSKEYDTLELHEPTGGEMLKAMKETGLSMAIVAISLVAEIPRGAVEMMPISVINEASEFVLGFTTVGLETGAA